MQIINYQIAFLSILDMIFSLASQPGLSPWTPLGDFRPSDSSNYIRVDVRGETILVLSQA